MPNYNTILGARLVCDFFWCSSDSHNPQDSGDDLARPGAARGAPKCRISIRFLANAFFATFSGFSQIAESLGQRRRLGPPSWRPGGAQMPDYYINLDHRVFCELAKNSPKPKTISELLQMTRRLSDRSRSASCSVGPLCRIPIENRKRDFGIVAKDKKAGTVDLRRVRQLLPGGRRRQREPFAFALGKNVRKCLENTRKM